MSAISLKKFYKKASQTPEPGCSPDEPADETQNLSDSETEQATGGFISKSFLICSKDNVKYYLEKRK